MGSIFYITKIKKTEFLSRDKSWNIWVDTGGTFTDCIGIDPQGQEYRVKVLSSSGLRGTLAVLKSGREIEIETDWDAPDDFLNGFAFRMLQADHAKSQVIQFNSAANTLVLSQDIARANWEGSSFELMSPEEAPVLAARLITQTPLEDPLPPVNLRLATTRGTNALLERNGAPTALFITKGFADLLKIGNQQRPDLFALNIEKPPSLYESVFEVEERIGASGDIVQSLSMANLEQQVPELLNNGIQSAAVVTMNSHQNNQHEKKVGHWLRQKGLKYVSISSELSDFVKILPRAQTTLVNAYLAPVLQDYLGGVKKVMKKGRLLVMTSAGGLKESSRFTPKDGLLSGPAAGVVGAAAMGKEAGFENIISFDMGGTSTDVSRYKGDFEYVFEHHVGDAQLMAPAVSVETVAAGGGSVCWFDGHSLRVGPQSAGASPGPACYGAGGPLTVTDINLLAGRLDERNFHIPIDIDAAQKALVSVADNIDRSISQQTLIEGFLDIANQRMAEAIKKISLRKGYDPKEYALVSFGGAGAQHCCAIARQLQMKSIVIPGDAGLLSARGLGSAEVEHFEERQLLKPLEVTASQIPDLFDDLTERAFNELASQGYDQRLKVRRKALFLRLQDQESTLEIKYNTNTDIARKFENVYRGRYGHWVDQPQIEVESLRVVVSTDSEYQATQKKGKTKKTKAHEIGRKNILYKSETLSTPVYRRDDIPREGQLNGPALILDPYSTILVEPGWNAEIRASGSLVLNQQTELAEQKKRNRTEVVELELFTNRFTSIAEKMGEMLQRTALSVNVKERQDFSCALLNPRGELVVNAPHIPVHLGALGLCVRSVMEEVEMQPGDVVVTNHPAFGGSHLPDVTLISPVFTDQNELAGYVANRAHHAEIGGTRPGSMPPAATTLAEEGVVIPPMHLIKAGESQFEAIRQLLTEGPYPTRNVQENIADLQAQLAANQQGGEALRALVREHRLAKVQYYMNALKDRAAELMRSTIKDMANGVYESKELLDDNTPLCCKWTIRDSTLEIDFEGTGDVHPTNLNATPAIVNSVIMYVLRVLVNEPIPLNEGLMKPVSVKLPESLLNPTFGARPEDCPAVVGGNVEISQRLTDTLLKPFERIACGQGTMNNVLFGNDSFGYYETVGGGSGAGPEFDGADAVHQHMTNTRGTDPEIFEQRYPVHLNRYQIRKNSGGRGKRKGGEGIIRDITFLEPVELSVLTQHRRQAPYAQRGAEPGKVGRQKVIRKNGDQIELSPADSCDLETGDRFILFTPGGGGFGEALDKKIM